jgi:hypothetical protein
VLGFQRVEPAPARSLLHNPLPNSGTPLHVARGCRSGCLPGWRHAPCCAAPCVDSLWGVERAAVACASSILLVKTQRKKPNGRVKCCQRREGGYCHGQP